jgi:hypothetical protein
LPEEFVLQHWVTKSGEHEFGFASNIIIYLRAGIHIDYWFQRFKSIFNHTISEKDRSRPVLMTFNDILGSGRKKQVGYFSVENDLLLYAFLSNECHRAMSLIPQCTSFILGIT